MTLEYRISKRAAGFNFRRIEHVGPDKCRDLVGEIRERFFPSLDGPVVDHARLTEGDPGLPAARYEWVATAFLGQGRPVYIVLHDCLFDEAVDCEALYVEDGRYASFLAWWSGVTNYYIVDASFGFIISASRFTLQFRGEVGLPDCVFTSARAQPE